MAGTNSGEQTSLASLRGVERPMVWREGHLPRSTCSVATYRHALSMLIRGMNLDGLEEGEAPRWRDATTGEAATVHGMRSSFRVWATATRPEPAEVVEAALAHAIRNAVVAAYLRTDFLAQRVALMEAWGAWVMRGGENPP